MEIVDVRQELNPQVKCSLKRLVVAEVMVQKIFMPLIASVSISKIQPITSQMLQVVGVVGLDAVINYN